MKENSTEEDIARIARLITTKFNNDYSIDNKDKEAIEHILSAYKRALKENEEWDRKFCNLQNLYFKLQDELESKRKEYQETYKDVREELKELRKENEELKIIKSAIQTLQINSIKDEKYIVISKSSFLDGSYKHLLDDYIPVQKVKDKIEKLNKIEQDLQNSISMEEREEYSDANISWDLMNINIRREELQELIEESEEK